jgi:hypothetical protein
VNVLPKARLVLALLLVGVPVAGAASSVAPVAGSWRMLPRAPIHVDGALTSAWTGTELVVFGRRDDIAHPQLVHGAPRYWTNVAAAYDPAARRWRRLTPPPAADTVGDEAAFWTGRLVVVLGPFHTLLYDPATDRWRSLPRGHGGLAAWTGSELLAWGGGCCGDADADGVELDPTTGRWRRLPTSPLAGSQHPTGAWDGKELLLFVGDRDANGRRWPARLARAAAYDPATRRWRRIARPPRFHLGAQAVWTGRELLLLGGYASATSPVPADAYAYDPAAARWRTLPRMEQGHVGAAAAWTGSRLLLWGGLTGPADRPQVPPYGLAYAPGGSWTPLPQAPLRGRFGPTTAWTGRAFLVWGGSRGSRSFQDGAAFAPGR